MIRMICLANSWRDGGRCVAGISVRTGQWVRPVPPGGGPIPENLTAFDGRFLAPLDVVELDLARPTLSTRYQRENCEVRDWRWRVVGRVEAASLLPHCNTSSIVLHNRKKVVDLSLLEPLDAALWSSLELIRVKDLSFAPDSRKPDRWQASFSAGKLGRKYTLPLTDPNVTARLKAGVDVGLECLLTVSLTVPVALPQFDLPPLCYKLVAAAMEL